MTLKRAKGTISFRSRMSLSQWLLSFGFILPLLKILTQSRRSPFGGGEILLKKLDLGQAQTSRAPPVGIGEVRIAKIRVLQPREGEVRAVESPGLEARAGKIGAGEAGACEVSHKAIAVATVGCQELRALGFEFLEVCAAKNSAIEFGAIQDCAIQLRFGEIGPGQVNRCEVGEFERAFCEFRARQIGA